MSKAILRCLFVLAFLGAASTARAGNYVDGTAQFNYAWCPGANVTVLASMTWASYWAETPTSPQTGDTAYVRAVAWNTSGCVNDTHGFFFTLPQGAQLAISAANPVLCFRGNSNGSEPVPNTGNSACLQTPEQRPEGLFFGYSALPPGWFIEIRIPVTYVRAYGGASAPQYQLRVQTTSAWGPMFPNVLVPIRWRPRIENHSVISSTAFDAKVGFDLTHYYEYGTVDILYSTDPSFNYSVGVQQTAQVQTDPNLIAHLGSTATLPNLVGGTTYYWRVRAASYLRGVELGPVQSFTTPLATIYRPPQYCRWPGC